MSRRVHQAPLALTSDGEILLNVGRFDDVRSLDEVLGLARAERGPVFVGVALRDDEVRLASRRLADAAEETAALLGGERRRQKKDRKSRENGELARPATPAMEMTERVSARASATPRRSCRRALV